jgi:uncharacterized protein
MIKFRSCLYDGSVMHKRLIPFHYRLDYKVFTLCLDIDELPRISRDLRWLKHNRFGLFSFHDRDHGLRDGSPLRPWIEAALQHADIDAIGGKITMVCFPRLLGYAFNPIAVYYCYDRTDKLRAILYQVKNTFGEQHSYLIPVTSAQMDGGIIRQQCAKEFYVSPFIGMTADYRFRLREPDENLSILIRQSVPEGELLLATWTGRRTELSDKTLLQAFWRYPLMTAKIIVAIHWNALWIWLKGAAFHHRPRHRDKNLTIVR